MSKDKRNLNGDIVRDAIDSPATKEEIVARKRFQVGSVYLNRTETGWLGSYLEYIRDQNGIERRKRKERFLCLLRKLNGKKTSKREAQRLLQPYIDRANAIAFAPVQELKRITFDEFVSDWERDHLAMYKPSTQATMRGQVKLLQRAFGSKDLREIGAGDLQQFVAELKTQEYAPKTIRNVWITIRLILSAALAQEFVDRIPAKPKLPKAFKTKPKHFLLTQIARIIAASKDELRLFYWLLAETGLRAGESAGLALDDVGPESVTVRQSVWNGQIGTPKTQSAQRTIAVSPQLAGMLSEQIVRQNTKGHTFLFSTSTGTPWDMNLFRKRKMQPLLASLEIQQAGFHAFRHFSASLLDSLRVPLKTIQERLGHALSGSLALDVYTHAEMSENVEAARRAGEAIEKAVNSVSLTAV